MAGEIQDSGAPADSAARLDRADWLSFAVTTALALSVYLLTLAPDVKLEFSGIMSTDAEYAGVPHPPGYPAWTIYSWFFTKLLPFSNIAWRVAVGSAVASALACGLVAMMVSHGGRTALGGVACFTSLKPGEQQLIRGVCGYAAGLVLGFSGAVWGKAVIADIWALSLLLFVGVLSLLMRWILQPEQRRFLYAAFPMFGLLLTSNQEMIVAVPGLVGTVMLADPKLGRDAALLVLPLVVVATAANQFGVWVAYPTKLNRLMLAAFALVGLIGVVLAVRTRRGRLGMEVRAALAEPFCCWDWHSTSMCPLLR